MITPLERAYIRKFRDGEILNPCPNFDVTTKYRQLGDEWSLGYHTGEDHECPVGTPVVAVSWGHVIGAGWGGAPHALGADYGNVVIIERERGDYEYFYAHLSRIHVRLGESVKPGQVVGFSGVTGHTFGPHLHFEARPVNGSFGSDIQPELVERIHR